jgi:hypothetical protein
MDPEDGQSRQTLRFCYTPSSEAFRLDIRPDHVRTNDLAKKVTLVVGPCDQDS